MMEDSLLLILRELLPEFEVTSDLANFIGSDIIYYEISSHISKNNIVWVWTEGTSIMIRHFTPHLSDIRYSTNLSDPESLPKLRAFVLGLTQGEKTWK